MSQSLPDGFPERIAGKLAWSALDYQSDDLVDTDLLSANDVQEIEAAVKHFQGLGLARGFASPETFPLSAELSQRLHSITDHVYNGRGFHRLRGLDPTRYTAEERIIIYAGLTSHVADQRARNIDHIRDRTFANPAGDKLKPLELPVSMTFHTDIDVSDLLTMFIQSTPLEGGEQYLASIASIYNEIVATEPQVIRTLAQDWHWERAFRPEPNEEIVRKFSRPLLSYEDGRLQVNFAATFIGGNPNYPLSSSAPPLTSEQQRALTVIQAAADRTSVRLEPQPGDMVFINNYALLHARGTWVDSKDDASNQRYIMRLWLHDTEKGWKSADALKRKLDDNFDLGPKDQGLYTGEEWDEIPRGMRVKLMGVSASDCHD